MKHSYIDTCFPVHIVKLNCDCRFHSLCLNLELSLIVTGYIKNIKRGITLLTFDRVSWNLCLAHLHIIRIMWSKFHLDDLKTVRVTTFHQQTNNFYLTVYMYLLQNTPPTIISLVGGIIKYLQQRGLCN